jgi:hypothetical protein
MRNGNTVEIRDARYFANFVDLIYKGQDVLTPFWLDSGIMVPNSKRGLLVPVSHSQHEVWVGGPTINAALAFYFGIDGKAEFRPIDTKDQSWVMGRVAHSYKGDSAIEVIRFAGEIIRVYDQIQRAHRELPFGGYYNLGVCNDVNAMIEQKMQGKTTLFPLTHDKRLFAGYGELERVVTALPVDGREDAEPDFARILGSLPVTELAQLPIPSFRTDLEASRGAWEHGKLGFETSSLWNLLGLVALLIGAWYLVRSSRKRN